MKSIISRNPVSKEKLLSGIMFLLILHTFGFSGSGIVGKWTFDEIKNDSIYDVSGNGNHFKLINGPILVPGLKGNALAFDGIDDKGLCADQACQSGMSALTIESILYVEDHIDGQWRPIIGKWGPGSSEDDAWALDVDRSTPYGGHGVVVGNYTQHLFGATPIPLQKWIHLAFIWDGVKQILYLNGKKVDSVSGANIGSIKHALTDIRLGHNVDPHFFKGKIDEITLYNYALSPETILENSKIIPQDTPKVIAKWTFDNASEDLKTFYDSTGNGYNAFATVPFALTKGLKNSAVEITKPNFEFHALNSKGNFELRNFTIEAWIYSYTGFAANTYETNIFTYNVCGQPGTGISAGYGIAVHRDSTLFCALAHPSVTWVSLNGKTKLKCNTWYHVVGTYDGSYIKIYVNGSIENSMQWTQGYTPPISNPNATDAMIAHSMRLPNDVSSWFNGKMDELALYNYALSADTILAHYNKLKPVDTPRVIAQWTFDEIKNDSVYDLSGNGNHFKLLNGPKLVPGIKGNALEFDGVDDKGLCADQACQSGMSALTIESIVYVEDHIDGQWRPIIGKWGPGGSEDDAWALDVDRSTPYGGHGVVVGNYSQHLFGATPIPLQKWIHLVFTWDGRKQIMYLDGKKVDSVAGVNIGSIKHAFTDVRLGHNVDPNFFNGKIDQITIYNYALSADTILAHYKSLQIPQSEVNLGIKKHYAKAGEELWVPVYITNYKKNYSINSIHFTVNVDTTVATFVNANLDSGIVKDWTCAVNSAKKDSVIFSLAGLQHPLGFGEGELLRCKFKVNTVIGPDTIGDLVFRYVKIDEGNDSIKVTTTPGQIIISKPDFLYGDVSGNREVTAYDAAGVIQYVLGQLQLPNPNFPNFTLKIADVSGDTTISSYDAALIMQYSVGLISKFPVERRYRYDNAFKPPYPNSTLRLLKSGSSTDKIAIFDLFGTNIRGAISADIKLKYNSKKILAALGGIITPSIYGKLESSLDTANQFINISFVTTDNVEYSDEFRLMTIAVPVADTADIARCLLFLSAIVDEEKVEHLIPSVITEISNPQIVQTRTNRIIAQNSCGIVIYNNEKIPVSVILYDLRGKKILDKQFQPAVDVIKIDTRHFASGIYISLIKMGARYCLRQFYIAK